MMPTRDESEFVKRTRKRGDGLLDKLNAKLERALAELREQGKENAPGIDDEFERIPKNEDQER